MNGFRSELSDVDCVNSLVKQRKVIVNRVLTKLKAADIFTKLLHQNYTKNLHLKF